MTQQDMILNHIRTYGGITSQEAFKKYGVTRLSDVVYKLKRRGFVIEPETIKSTNRYGKKVHFARYVLRGL